MKCLRCGTDRKKRLVALREPALGMDDERATEFYVCRNRKACRARQQAARPARMKVNESDTRECGWMGCPDYRCEDVCQGIPKNRQFRTREEHEAFLDRIADLIAQLRRDRETLPNGI